MPIQNHNPLQGKRQTDSPEREAAIARFWNQYIAVIHDKGIKEPFDRWFGFQGAVYVSWSYCNTSLLLALRKLIIRHASARGVQTMA